MKLKFSLAIFIFGLMTGCSTKATAPAPMETTGGTGTVQQVNRADQTVAAAGESCFNKGTKYSDGAASCQVGVQYTCSNGEWVNVGTSCTEEKVAISKPCQFAGVTFPTGAASCQAGTQYRCEDGEWRGLGIACPGTEPTIRLVPGGRTCMFNDITVATSSTVCRSGTTFLCNDGEWINLGTLCR